ncbi:AraC family transcriptional regulator ligand-binding domain-containing protein [Alcanivorax sp.]|jgi:AraC-like DNA-binding protein|uniref:AraC family transcriptional regulator n=1 Tax=Alcanivorax sp. TaxID=1872427 RepID=UPI0032D9A70E
MYRLIFHVQTLSFIHISTLNTGRKRHHCRLRQSHGIFRHNYQERILVQHISTIYARFICRELQLPTSEIDALLDNSSLSHSDIVNSATMPYLDFFAFLDRVIVTKSAADLGLKIGAQLTPPSLGELGNAMLCAPTFWEACKLAETFISVHVGYIRLQVDHHDNGVILSFFELANLGDTRRFQTEVLMLLVQNLIEAATCQPFDQGRLLFPYPAPDNHEQYADYFHSPVEFSSPCTAMEIPHHYLETSSPFYDPVAWKSTQLTLKTRKQQLQYTERSPYTQQVIHLLHEQGEPWPSASQTAHRLNMTERSLSRHLKQESTSYRSIRNRLLQERAQFYLHHTGLSVDAIASQLGYRDYSSFRRAFKKWQGCTPSHFRQQKSPPRSET